MYKYMCVCIFMCVYLGAASRHAYIENIYIFYIHILYTYILYMCVYDYMYVCIFMSPHI